MNLNDAILFIGVVSLVMLIGMMLGGRRRQMQKRIARIHTRKTPTTKTSADAAATLRRRSNEPTRGIVYWLTKPLPDFKKLGDKLERAGRTITPKQYVFRRFVYFLIIAALVTLITKKSFVAGALAGLVLGVWLPLKLLQRVINKQSKAFLQLFPDAIDLIVRGLRSGLPVSESIVLVSHEVPDPVGSVFLNISNTMKLGVPLEKALQETARKLDMTEFNFFTTSIILQRETGGNLSEILNNLSEVLRNRYLMRMKIKAMSAEARASAYIIGALPFIVILAVVFTSPGYMSVLYTDPRGNVCAAVAAAMMIFGLWVMNRMTKFEI